MSIKLRGCASFLPGCTAPVVLLNQALQGTLVKKLRHPTVRSFTNQSGIKRAGLDSRHSLLNGNAFPLVCLDKRAYSLPQRRLKFSRFFNFAEGQLS